MSFELVCAMHGVVLAVSQPPLFRSWRYRGSAGMWRVAVTLQGILKLFMVLICGVPRV